MEFTKELSEIVLTWYWGGDRFLLLSIWMILTIWICSMILKVKYINAKITPKITIALKKMIYLKYLIYDLGHP